MSTVAVIGDTLLDVHVHPAAPISSGGDVPAEIRIGPGGQGANVAIRLARRGVAVRLACGLADDRAGQMLRDAVTAEGVTLHRLPVPATGSVVVLGDPGGERTMLSDRPSLARGLAAASLAELLAGVSWLVVSGYLLLESRAGVSGSGDRPRRALLGCAVEPPAVPDWLRSADSLDPHLVVVNATEAAALAGGDHAPADLARRVSDRLGAVAAVTHPGGAAAALPAETLEVAATSVTPVVDTTGAGDAFAAGLVAGLLETVWPPPVATLREALKAATRLASAVTGVRGAQTRVAGEATP
jgi:ribokinase